MRSGYMAMTAAAMLMSVCSGAPQAAETVEEMVARGNFEHALPILEAKRATAELAGRRDAEQASGVRAAHAEPAGHTVALRDHLFYGALQIRYPLP